MPVTYFVRGELNDYTIPLDSKQMTEFRLGGLCLSTDLSYVLVLVIQRAAPLLACRLSFGGHPAKLGCGALGAVRTLANGYVKLVAASCKLQAAGTLGQPHARGVPRQH